MNRRTVYLLRSVSLLAVLLVAGCASSRLPQKVFEGRRIAATAAFPPDARVRHPLLAVSDRRLPGVLLAERRELERLQSVLKAATKHADIPGRIAGEMIRTGADELGTVISNDPKNADYVLDFRVYDYGLRVSYSGNSASFYIESEALMWDQEKGEVIWRERLNRVSSFKVKLGGQRMKDITEADLEEALEEFTAFASERMQTALRKDIVKE
ncbi:MAG: hypothetical protein ACE5G0_05890 [Rhodothermales bacterium]